MWTWGTLFSHLEGETIITPKLISSRFSSQQLVPPSLVMHSMNTISGDRVHVDCCFSHVVQLQFHLQPEHM